MKNIKQFVKESRQIQEKLFGNKEYNPKETILNFRGKIGSNEDNKQYVKNILNKEGQFLMIAPTGTGKTYLINEVFEELINDNKKLLEFIKKSAKESNLDEERVAQNLKQDVLYIIACPSKLQNEQNENSYNFKALVAGENADIDNLKLSAVYEKVEDIIELKKSYDLQYTNKKLKVVMVIDEAHTLVNALDYRKGAVDKIVELSKIATTTVYLTATGENLKVFKFNEIVLFKDKEYKAPTKEVVIKVAEDVKELTKKVAQEENKPFIRVNSKSIAENIALELKVNDDKKVVTVSSDTKTYKVIDNIKVYDNEVYDGVIRQETLPNKVNDIVFTTGVLDAGTNIVNYHQDTTPVFSCLNAKHLQLDDIEQFWNRIRGVVNKSLLLVGKTENKNKFLSIDFILKQEIEKVERVVKSFELRLQAIKLMTDDKEEILNDIQEQLNHIKKDGTKNHMNCIDINNKLEITVDRYMIWKGAYDRFNRQYYYHLDKLKKVIKDRLNVEVRIEEVEINKGEKVVDNTANELKEEVLRTINVLNNTNPKELKDLFEKNINLLKVEDNELVKMLKLVKEHKYYNLMRDMLKVGIDYEVALDVINESVKYADVNKFIIDYEIKNNNKDYLNNIPLTGELGLAQELILNKLCKFNNKGYMKVKAINKEIIEDITNELNNKLGNVYKKSGVKKLIKQVFNTSTDKINGLRITSLNK